MNITNNSVVCFHFSLKNTEGEILDSSEEREPSVYLHGAGNLMPLLERELEGLSAGEHIEVSLDALDAFGPRQDSLTQQVAVKNLRGAKRKLVAGDRAQMKTSEGEQTVTIVKMGKFQAMVDANHPLAGQDVTFDIDIAAVREATTEEIAHGHAHGPDGHGGH
jgi:FKBP-type peptidyl-prolyl cis-trans isomerase SlyD